MGRYNNNSYWDVIVVSRLQQIFDERAGMGRLGCGTNISWVHLFIFIENLIFHVVLSLLPFIFVKYKKPRELYNKIRLQR